MKQHGAFIVEQAVLTIRYSLEVLRACVDGHTAVCRPDALDSISGQLRDAVAHHHCSRPLHTCEHKHTPQLSACVPC